MTLAATIAMKFMDGDPLLILPGFLIAVSIGLERSAFRLAHIRRL